MAGAFGAVWRSEKKTMLWFPLPPAVSISLSTPPLSPTIMRCVGLFFSLFALLASTSAAQETSGPTEGGGDVQGVVRLVDWPDPSKELSTDASIQVLPFLDTLTLGYRYGDGEAGPTLEAMLEWTPAARGIYDGQEVDIRAFPEHIEMEAVVLRAQVYTGGRPVGETTIDLRGMALAASPDVHTVHVDTLDWATVFNGLSAEAARAAFESGFELGDLEIIRVAFAAFDDVVARHERPRRRPRPTHTTVYEPFGPQIYISGGIGGRSRPRALPRGQRREMGRGSAEAEQADRSRTRSGDASPEASGSGDQEGAQQRGGRTSSGETAEGGKSSAEGKKGETSRRGGRKVPLPKGDDDDDDDNEDNELLPAALAAAAAVGVVAYAGGTVGYYGNAAKAPIGLTSGFVRPRGGVLLQAAVNESLITSGPGPRNLVAKVTGFYDAFGAPVQPAVGLGVLARDPGENIDIQPSLSLGAVATLGPIVLMGGYDVARGGAEIGVAFNFRYKRSGEEPIAARK